MWALFFWGGGVPYHNTDANILGSVTQGNLPFIGHYRVEGRGMFLRQLVSLALCTPGFGP